MSARDPPCFVILSSLASALLESPSVVSLALFTVVTTWSSMVSSHSAFLSSMQVEETCWEPTALFSAGEKSLLWLFRFSVWWLVSKGEQSRDLSKWCFTGCLLWPKDRTLEQVDELELVELCVFLLWTITFTSRWEYPVLVTFAVGAGVSSFPSYFTIGVKSAHWACPLVGTSLTSWLRDCALIPLPLPGSLFFWWLLVVSPTKEL